jgi:DNA-binding transcriptional LysR family regulator
MQTQIRDMEYFAAIAQHGQVQRAAAALGLSQPALSKSLRRLERAMNAKLLKRTPKGVELTSVGAALLARVNSLRLSLDDLTREIAYLSEGRAGYLRIGIAAALGHVVPIVCTALLREAPRLTVKLTDGDHPGLVTSLRDGALDIAVSATGGSHHEDLIEVRLCDDDSAIYASTNHRLAKRKRVSLVDLAQESWILPAHGTETAQLLTKALASVGLPPPRIAIEATYMMTRFHAVAASELLTYGSKVVAKYAAGHLGIVDLRVTGLSGDRRVCVTYRKDAYLPPAAFRFIETLKATVKSTNTVGHATRRYPAIAK